VTSSGAEAASGEQKVAAFYDAMLVMPAAGASTRTTSQVDLRSGDASSTEVEPWASLLESFLKWADVERGAMKCKNPVFPCGDEVALSDSVKRHLAFNRILELWQENCTCGEYRTVRLNAGLCDSQCVKKTFGVMTNR